MTAASPPFDIAPPRAAAAPRVRDPRLDFFRGLAMLIILIAHVPGNSWNGWIPARFGFSDATEIFVFCSGMASAIAFGTTFERAGWWMGTARTAHRVWQVYWAHIALFFFIAMNMALLDLSGAFEVVYVDQLNLRPFFDAPMQQLVGLFTLAYVPNYFDILPMYLVILAMMPVVIALREVHLGLAIGFCVAIWLGANFNLLDLPAEPWSDRTWFFNPFGWQLIFFSGFALMAGWLPRPPVSFGLGLLAAAFLILTLPLSSGHAVGWLEAVWPAGATWSMEVYPAMAEWRIKSEFGILRYIHFLSLAYLAWLWAGEGGRRLLPSASGIGAIWARVVAVVTKVGQQSLAIFITSMALARLMGVALDLLGRSPVTTAMVNIAGLIIVMLAAYLIAWFKGAPWRARR